QSVPDYETTSWEHLISLLMLTAVSGGRSVDHRLRVSCALGLSIPLATCAPESRLGAPSSRLRSVPFPGFQVSSRSPANLFSGGGRKRKGGPGLGAGRA